MPRTGRVSAGGVVYHAMNRGKGGKRIFSSQKDYDAFVKVLTEAAGRSRTRVLGWCLMPDHFHLVIWPRKEGELSDFMRWLMNTFVRRHQQWGRGRGRMFDGRFRSFMVAPDKHLLMLMRYVEQNPVRSKLAKRAGQWKWSSLGAGKKTAAMLSAWPVTRPRNWDKLINQPIDEKDLQRVRTSAARGRPLGDAKWVQRMAKKHGIEQTLRPRGRPRKEPGQSRSGALAKSARR